MDVVLRPAWDEFRAEEQLQRLLDLLQRFKAQWSFWAAQPASFATVLQPLLDHEADIEQAFAPISHLQAVLGTEDWRQAHAQAVAAWSQTATELYQHAGLYAQIQCILAQEPLDHARQRITEIKERDFRLTGVALPEAQRAAFAAHALRLSELSTTFAHHVLDATEAVHFDVARERLAGLPPAQIALWAQPAEAGAATIYRITLRQPDYIAIMTHAEDRSLREQIYAAYVQRASAWGPKEFDNGPLMLEILAHRQAQAELLGFADYTELALQGRMADSLASVRRLLEDLLARSTPAAQDDWQDILAQARACGLEEVQAWDVAYLSERLRVRHHAYRQEDLRPFLPLPTLLERIFALLHRLWGIRVRRVPAVTWHADVFYLEFEEQGQVIAGCYCDLFAREGKRAGAWMADLCGRRALDDGRVQAPIALLTCNFRAPGEDGVAYLDHDELSTFLHELGHGLQHMLTRIALPGVSGIAGIAWDAVELPSQFMEHFAQREATLLPLLVASDEQQEQARDLVRRIVAGRHFQSALLCRRQIELALFDLTIHAQPARSEEELQAQMDAIRQRTSMLQPPSYNRFQHSFTHIFAGGYAAGYYSYKWAEVLAADAFAAVAREGLQAASLSARRFRDTILALGGAWSAGEVFRMLMGRDPDMSALLDDYAWRKP